MNNKNYWTPSVSSLDKVYKRGYNEKGIPQKSKSIFNSDAFASSALDYLYSNNNRDKTRSFLKNNGFPSAEDREYNKKYYGVQEENKRMLDLFKKKTNRILNPRIPDDTDRAFLSGFLGKEEEENNYKIKY